MPRPARLNRSNSKSSSTAIIATWLTLAITLVTLNLTLLGYGYDLGYLETLGLHPEDFQRTPLDFLLRSWRPLAVILEKLVNYWSIETQQYLWEHFFWRQQLYILLLAIPVFTAVLAFCVHHKDRFNCFMSCCAQRCRSFLFIRCAWLPRHMHSMKTKGRFVLEKFKEHRRIRIFGYSGSIVSLGAIVILLFTTTFIWLILLVGTILIVNVPFFGTSAGMDRAKKEILNPIGCSKHVNPEKTDHARLANCVRVMREDKELASGYQVDYSASRVFLFQPCVNRIVSFPLATSSVEHIERLEYDVRDKDCASYAKYKKSIARQSSNNRSNFLDVQKPRE